MSSIFTFVARSSSDPWRDISGTDVQPVDDMPHLLRYPTLGFGTPLCWFTKNVVYMDHYVGAVCTNNGHQTVHRTGFSTWHFVLRRWYVAEKSSYYKHERWNLHWWRKYLFWWCRWKRTRIYLFTKNKLQKFIVRSNQEIVTWARFMLFIIFSFVILSPISLSDFSKDAFFISLF